MFNDISADNGIKSSFNCVKAKFSVDIYKMFSTYFAKVVPTFATKLLEKVFREEKPNLCQIRCLHSQINFRKVYSHSLGFRKSVLLNCLYKPFHLF